MKAFLGNHGVSAVYMEGGGGRGYVLAQGNSVFIVAPHRNARLSDALEEALELVYAKEPCQAVA